MTLNRSSYNIKLFKEEYKKYIWASALSCIFYIFAKIVPPLLEFSAIPEDLNQNEKLYRLISINSYLTVNNSLNKFITALLAVIVGTAIFSYLHNRKKIDFYHSLPISRNNLFFTKYIIGIFIVIPIMIIIQLLSFGILSIILKENITGVKDVFEAIAFDTLFFISIYSFVVFSNIIAGNTIIGVLLSGIIINLGTIITAIIISLCEVFFRGVYLNYLLDYQIKYNPIICYFSLQNNKEFEPAVNISFSKINLLITHIIITIIIAIICWLLFKVRKSEKSNICLSFKYAKTILKYLGVCIGSILMGLIFYAITYKSFSLYFGVILGSIILHCIVEIIYDFDFRAMFKNWYSIIGCAIISCVIICTFQFDLFKTQRYIPSINKISNIDINNTSGISNSINDVENDEIIEIITGLHQISVKNYDFKNNTSNTNENNNIIGNFTVTYNLKNNLVVKRNLYIYDESLNLLKQLMSKKEYIQKALPFLYDTNILKNNFTIRIFNNANNLIYVTDYEKSLNLIEVLKKDIEQNGIYNDAKPKFAIHLEILPNDNYNTYDDYYINVYDTYNNTLDYIINTLNLNPKNLDSNYVNSISFYDIEIMDNIEIKDKEIIDKILSNYLIDNIYRTNFNYNYDYSLNLIDKNGNYMYINVPGDLLKKLNLIN